MTQESEYTIIFKKKYPWLDTVDLQLWEARAKEILIHLSFPSEKIVSQENKEYVYDYYKYWIMACMQELIERSGSTSAVGYSENGINISYDRAQISKALVDEVIPFIGIR